MYESVGANMQVSAISSNQGFTGRTHKRDNIDRVIALDDNQLKEIAYLQTIKKTRERQDKVNKLYNAVPIVGALSAGILTNGKAGMFGKEVGGLAAKSINAGKGGAYWAMLLGLAGTIGLATKAITSHSDTANRFKQNHPLVTLAGQIGALFAALTYLPKGASKLYKMIKPEYIAKAGKGVEQVAEHINKIKTPKFMNGWGKAISDKIPNCIKEFGKKVVAYAPDVTLFTAALGTIRAMAGETVDYSNTYYTLKERQHQLAQARLNELKAMNMSED